MFYCKLSMIVCLLCILQTPMTLFFAFYAFFPGHCLRCMHVGNFDPYRQPLRPSCSEMCTIQGYHNLRGHEKCCLQHFFGWMWYLFWLLDCVLHSSVQDATTLGLCLASFWILSCRHSMVSPLPWASVRMSPDTDCIASTVLLSCGHHLGLRPEWARQQE